MDPPDDLDEYLRGDSALSRQYRRESAPTPAHALDRRVLGLSRGTHVKSPCLAPLAFAASVLLSVALVLAIVFRTQPRSGRGMAALSQHLPRLFDRRTRDQAIRPPLIGANSANIPGFCAGS